MASKVRDFNVRLVDCTESYVLCPGSFPLAYVCSLLEGTRVLKFEDSQVCLDEFSKMLGKSETAISMGFYRFLTPVDFCRW